MKTIGIIVMATLIILEAMAIGMNLKEKPSNHKGDIINRVIIIMLALEAIITRFH